MILKDSKTVVLGPVHPAIHHAMNVVDTAWRKITGHQARVTGLGEEGHSDKSRHYGIPGDIRLRAFDVDADDTAVCPDTITEIDLEKLASGYRSKLETEIRTRLAHPHEFQVIFEFLGTVRAHMHIEYDPMP